MDRRQLQIIAKERLKDAKALLGRKRWGAAYYLCGYVVECALKACLLRHLGESGAVFGDADYVRKKLIGCWTHDLVKLVELAGLEATLATDCRANAVLNDFWDKAKEWTETSRYDEKTEAEAKDLYQAVSNKPDGVFQWIQSRW